MNKYSAYIKPVTTKLFRSRAFSVNSFNSILSIFLPLIINNRALVVKYENEYYSPILTGYIPGSQFGQDVPGEARYRQLKAKFNLSDKGDWVLMPLYPYSPYEDITFQGNKAYQSPSAVHWLGTDNTGRDVFARLCYAFNISISFALVLTVMNYIIGILIIISLS